MLSQIIAFLGALPALIKLFQVLQQRLDEEGIDRHVKEDVQTIHEAFDAKDPQKLNDLFNAK